MSMKSCVHSRLYQFLFQVKRYSGWVNVAALETCHMSLGDVGAFQSATCHLSENS